VEGMGDAAVGEDRSPGGGFRGRDGPGGRTRDLVEHERHRRDRFGDGTTSELVVHVHTSWISIGCIAGAMMTRPTVAVAPPARPKPVRFVHHVDPSDCD
jgi:hypothetical protein